MGIRFSCPNGHHLHVKAFLAGKRGICPHCDVRFEIPLADTGRVRAFTPMSRPQHPFGGGRLATGHAATADEPAPAVALQIDSLGSEPLRGAWKRTAAIDPSSATKNVKNLVLLLSALVVVLAGVLVFVVIYFGDG